MKFFKDENNNILEGVVLNETGLKEIVPNTVDAAKEKHVPVVTVEGNVVSVVVGDVIHPMTEAHYITLIALETNKGVKKVYLTPNDEPKATFALLDGEEVVAAYEYCNLHGLWKK